MSVTSGSPHISVLSPWAALLLVAGYQLPPTIPNLCAKVVFGGEGLNLTLIFGSDKTQGKVLIGPAWLGTLP